MPDPISDDLVQLLACPETRQSVRRAAASLVDEINQRIESGALENRAKTRVSDPIDGGLVRDDGKVLYPVRRGIPWMLIDEAIALDSLSGESLSEELPRS